MEKSTIVSFILLIIFVGLALKGINLGSKFGKKGITVYLIITFLLVGLNAYNFKYEFSTIKNNNLVSESDLKSEILGCLSKDEKIKNISKNGSEIILEIELSKNDKILAETRYSTISDKLLEDKKWKDININFIGIGNIKMNSDNAKVNEYKLKYFPIEDISKSWK